MVKNSKVWFALRDGKIDASEYYKIMMEIESKQKQNYVDEFSIKNNTKTDTKGYRKK